MSILKLMSPVKKEKTLYESIWAVLKSISIFPECSRDDDTHDRERGVHFYWFRAGSYINTAAIKAIDVDLDELDVQTSMKNDLAKKELLLKIKELYIRQQELNIELKKMESEISGSQKGLTN